MYVAPEVKVLMALANVAATSNETEPATPETTIPSVSLLGDCL